MKLSLLFLVCSGLSGGFASAAQRVALVIGNDAYQHARKLNAAVNDAAAVGEALNKLGFHVISVKNGGVEHMLEAVAKLKKEANGAESVMVYYAGHGIESNGVNYLVPVDAKLEKEIQLKTQAVSLDGILEELKDIKVPARIIILDCCRDNPLEGRSWLETRSSGGGGLAALAQDTLSEATLVVYSASPGKPALDRVNPGDAHSPFTTALLEQMPKPGVHSFEMFGLVEDGVIKQTGGRQSPRIFYNGSTQPFRNFRFATEHDLAVSEASPVRPDPLPAMTPAPEPAAAVVPAPTVAAVSPELPGSGYFDINELYEGGPYASFNAYSRGDILRRVQQKLKEQGLYENGLDGSPGPSTQRAILAWQQANCVEASGKLDHGTLRGLRLEGIGQMSPPEARPPSRPATRPAATPSRQKPAPARPRDDFFRDS